MINGKKVLALIPARGGSKGVPRKNIRNVGGRPLIAWTIEEAKKSQYIDRLILSSEDEEIITIAKQWGCEVPFVRPREFATDQATGSEVVLHAIDTIPEKYDYIVMLQPTSPLRRIDDIDGCIRYCVERNANACVSVSSPDKSPYWMFTLTKEGNLIPLIKSDWIKTNRQNLPNVYCLNGAIYIAKRDFFLKEKSFISNETIAYLMDKRVSLDIDTELDMDIANYLILRLKPKEN